MPQVTFDDWAGGLDVRPAAALSKTNILRVLTNAYVSTGKSIKKRPCLEFVYTLEPGTIGLRAFGGKLNTFYGHGAAITHANSLFVPRRVPHITTGAAPVKVHYSDQFNALLYGAFEYGDGTFRHHYLDDPGAWAPATAYTVGLFRRPTVANGFRYEITSISGTGTSAGGEPVWPTTVNTTVTDNPGANQVVWTCRTFAITDVNCPHTKQVAKQAQKIYATGVDGTTVRFTSTANGPRDWTLASDAGFLPVGRYAQGSNSVTCLAPFRRSSLAVLFSDNSQVWGVDPNPALNSMTDQVSTVGTLYSRGAGAVQLDTFFPAQNGFRSLALTVLSDNLQDTDVGSPIDDLYIANFQTTDDPLALYYPKLGQFWEINGVTAWAYSFSRTAKISAWSKFTFPFTIDDATVLNQEMYLRTGNDVYKVNKAIFKDGVSSIPLVDIQMFYQDAKVPGILKQSFGIDTMGIGSPSISFKFFDENGVERETQQIQYRAITEAGASNPMELLFTRVAPHVQHQLDEQFELSFLSINFERLGPL